VINYSTCRSCSKELDCDEISIYKKLVFRAATDFLCLDCLAEYLGTTRQYLEALIDYYYQSGTCALF
jgi:hypothetical protein